MNTRTRQTHHKLSETAKSARALLRNGIKLFEKSVLIKGSFSNEDTEKGTAPTAFCTVGALIHINGSNRGDAFERSILAMNETNKQIRKFAASNNDDKETAVYTWNDLKRRRKHEVLSQLRRAHDAIQETVN